MTVTTHPEQEHSDLKLSEMLSSHTVETCASVRDWEDAADRVGALLVNAGCVRPTYVLALKRVLKEMGPYAVIAPGIVLLHARPEEGVIKPCLGLVTLSTPVKFGHSVNDPVDLVFALGALDHQSHIHALQQLAGLLGDEDALTKLRSASDTEALIHVINEWSA